MRKLALTLIAILAVLPASAVEEQNVQGNYDGDGNTTAKVIAEGGGNYRVLLHLDGKRDEFRGKTASKGAVFSFLSIGFPNFQTL